MKEIEIWKDIKGYEGSYQVSSLGRVKSFKRSPKGYILKPHIDKDGYRQVDLSIKGIRKRFFIHRLVGFAFISNPKNYPVINHKDEDKTNNKVENLEWCTVRYNNVYGARLKKVSSSNVNGPGLKGRDNPRYGIKGVLHPSSKKVVQYSLEGELIKKWDCIRDVERKLGVKAQNISKACRNKGRTAKGFIWKYASEVK